MIRVGLLVVLTALTSCTSIVDGTTQSVSVETNPPGVTCNLVRDGENIATIQTPGSALIKRTRDGFTTTCKKEGFTDAPAFNSSGVNPWVFVNLLIGGAIGIIIDLADGAHNKYTEKTFVSLPQQPTLSTAPSAPDPIPPGTPAGTPAATAIPES